MRKALVFEASHDGYYVDQVVDRAMTVGELKELLEEWDDDTLVVMSYYRGDAFGSIHGRDCYVSAEKDDGEWQQVEC